ncbi:MAG TPA: hypothetical protein VF092_11810 [Longimicrobium sp.]
MTRFLATFGTLLFFSFIACCVASAALQVLAWTRHKLEGVPINPGALWKPEGFFDPVGLYQMKIAKRALLIGGVMYLSYGLLMIVAQTVVAR